MKDKIDEIVDAIVIGALSQTEATEELLNLFSVRGSFFDWDKFAKALDGKFGECLISADDADENNPYDYWLQDVTVADIVEFCKNYR